MFVYLKVIQMSKSPAAAAAGRGQQAPSSSSGHDAKKPSSESSSSSSALAKGKDKVCDENLCFNGAFCDPYGSECVCQGHFIGKGKNFDRFLRTMTKEANAYMRAGRV